MKEFKPVIEELVEECHTQAINPPKVNGYPDKYIAMFSEALHGVISSSDQVADVLAEAINAKREFQPFSASFAFNSIMRLFQMDRMDSIDYPYEDASSWRGELEEYLYDSHKLKNLSLDMQMWNVGSDVETRVAGPKLVANTIQAESDRSNFRILNIGSARDHALAMIAGNVALERVMLVKDADQEFDLPKIEERVNYLINKPISIGDCYGVDLWPLRDTGWSRFLRACRYYPSELSDKIKRQRYTELEDIRDADKRLHHVDADFSTINSSPSFSNGYLEGMHEDDSYDMVLFSTSLYQNYPEKRRVMINNARRLLRAGGFIVVQDFCDDQEGPILNPIDRLHFLGPTSTPFAYSTYVMGKTDASFERFASWNNGRCERVKLSDLALKRVV